MGFPNSVPEKLSKAFFGYVLDNTAVSKFCEGYNDENVPSSAELEAMLEEGYVGRYDLKKFLQKGIPVGLTKTLLGYLAGTTDSRKNHPMNHSQVVACGHDEPEKCMPSPKRTKGMPFIK